MLYPLLAAYTRGVMTYVSQVIRHTGMPHALVEFICNQHRYFDTLVKFGYY